MNESILRKLIVQVIEEEVKNFYTKDITRIASIINTILNDTKWQHNGHFYYSFGSYKKLIREFIEKQLKVFNYESNVQEGLTKEMCKALSKVERLKVQPQNFASVRTKYYDIRTAPFWDELQQELIAILQLNVHSNAPQGEMLVDSE